jgi:enoyl-CoA hydratase/carnithine racemase
MVPGMLTKEIRGATAWLTLDRPDKLNAMERSFYGELQQAAAEANADPAVRVVVLHGAGKCFSVGGDIKDFGNIGGVADRRAYMRESLEAFRAIDAITKPVIAAVHGYALGGGCELTMMCDIVVADTTARMGLPETGVGLVPGPGMVLGRTHLSRHWMKYLVMTGLPIGADDARLAGLVNTVVAEGEHLVEAERLADAIALRSPLALAVGKGILNRGVWDDQQYIAESNALLQGSADFAEGIAAFAERRPPAFTGA